MRPERGAVVGGMGGQWHDPDIRPEIKDRHRHLAKIDTGKIIDAIEPITFKWTVGGTETVEVDEEIEVHATETVTNHVSDAEMVNGRLTWVTKPVTEEVPLYDLLPVFNEDGTPATIYEGAKPDVLDAHGQIVRPATPARTVPRMHRVPRMVRKTVKVTKTVDRPGSRTHWGFSAEDLGRIPELAGLDYGGFVRSADGTLHRRPDQENAILWEEVRRLRARVAKLEGGK